MLRFVIVAAFAHCKSRGRKSLAPCLALAEICLPDPHAVFLPKIARSCLNDRKLNFIFVLRRFGHYRKYANFFKIPDERALLRKSRACLRQDVLDLIDRAVFIVRDAFYQYRDAAGCCGLIQKLKEFIVLRAPRRPGAGAAPPFLFFSVAPPPP